MNNTFNRPLIIGLIIFLSFNSCKKKEADVNFCIFSKELRQLIDSLNNNQVKLEKIIIKDQISEKLLLRNTEWDKELKIFTDHLLCQSIEIDYQFKETENSKTYTSINHNSIQSVQIRHFSNDHFIYTIKFNLKNRLALIKYELSIDNQKGYYIKSEQKIPYSYETNYLIKGNFQ